MHTDRTWTTTPVTAELLRGALDLERTARGVLPHRLPARARAQCTDPQLAMAESQPSGVRLVFRTRATAVELDTLPTKRVYTGAPPRPDGVYDLLVDGRLHGQGSVSGGATLTIDLTSGTAEKREGTPGTVCFGGLPARMKNVEIWLPHDETTELTALRTDAPVTPVQDDRVRKVWLHHGSSISHGSEAASPTGTWPALAASLGGVELINMGFGGGALLDAFTSRAMRDVPADLISVKIGINLVNSDAMRLRAFTPAVHGFLDTVREGHPDAPLLVISPVHCPLHEDTPGPTAPDFTSLSAGRLRFRATGDPAERAYGKLTLGVIREELARIVAERADGDPHLHHLDGRELYGEADHLEMPLQDGLHPDAATHRLMGERFTKLAFAAGGPFGEGGS
ncbi:GDSL-type esterase/lipase family protein [Streptomyces marispadix]|uniref:GDSL-type esterase/lipase family protein n=1 Tax=Streptomyces marispadix TaxID=2922868 RepID=A0ABS9T205_9ACTN|nr:GDSL-type esterase/lipase family protein [Streptomyces marispadix]MCH6162336.1 GDSL-type esterase/lipase family protein [Streptomyces marispadix]